MKFCVIGLGRLGYQVAVTLAENGMEVMAIDSNEASLHQCLIVSHRPSACV